MSSSPTKQQSDQPVITLSDLCLALGSQSHMTQILKQITVDVPKGQHIAILGPSGAGKTSLLMIMAGLEQATSGQVTMAGHDITYMKEDELAALRRDNVGIIFQAFRLIPSMTALQNVAVPMELAGNPDAESIASAALEKVGLGHRLSHLPDQLSGGEQQRVAIARAIAPRPRILLADEPTGNLDSKTGALVIDTLFEATKSVGAALVLITHDVSLAEQCERILTIEDGKLVKDEVRS
ncbi:MAG: ABC transporter ATP-binding protein [Candidatus Puniceispirillaceae bacterium]